MSATDEHLEHIHVSTSGAGRRPPEWRWMQVDHGTGPLYASNKQSSWRVRRPPRRRPRARSVGALGVRRPRQDVDVAGPTRDEHHHRWSATRSELRPAAHGLPVLPHPTATVRRLLHRVAGRSCPRVPPRDRRVLHLRRLTSHTCVRRSGDRRRDSCQQRLDHACRLLARPGSTGSVATAPVAGLTARRCLADVGARSTSSHGARSTVRRRRAVTTACQPPQYATRRGPIGRRGPSALHRCRVATARRSGVRRPRRSDGGVARRPRRRRRLDRRSQPAARPPPRGSVVQCIGLGDPARAVGGDAGPRRPSAYPLRV